MQGERKDLGADDRITRRDFVNGVAALGLVGAALAADRAIGQGVGSEASANAAAAWNGYGGIGDYADSNGNVWSTVSEAHREIRDDSVKALVTRALRGPADETYDFVIVGSGIAGLTAAYELQRQSAGARVLVLDNHPVFGGESKQNEFLVDGIRLTAPQGANGFAIEALDDTSTAAKLYRAIGMPQEINYRYATGTHEPLEFDRSNFGYKFKSDISPNWGWFFDETHGVAPTWRRNIWANDLRDTPFTEAQRANLLRWRTTMVTPYTGPNPDAWLDAMSYRDYLIRQLALSEDVISYINPVIGVDIGAGAEISALAARNGGYPGFIGMGGRDNDEQRYSELPLGARDSFPGGNSGIARHLLKAVRPDAITGDRTTESILTGAVDFARLDAATERVRFRQSATVLAIEHASNVSGRVNVVYRCADRMHSVRARAVVMGSASWVNKHVCRDLPEAYSRAMNRYSYTPVLVANIALRNWKFMDQLGITACRWFGGFGFAANIRPPMLVGPDTPPLQPDKPIVMTMYVPFGTAGLPLEAQGKIARAQILTTPFADYEQQIRLQMTKLFSMAGFDSSRDIAGIILNRWGHAYSNPWPGYAYGISGEPSSQQVLRQPFGRISFGHSEINGKQTWTGAVAEATRAAEQALSVA